LIHARITAVQPLWAVEGGRVRIDGVDFGSGRSGLPEVRVGSVAARVVHASPHSITILIPPGLEGGHMPIRVDGAPGETAFIDIGTPIATGLHQVDNPVFDRQGNLYVTYSGSRGEKAPVSIFRVRRDGYREPFVSGITNATSMAFDAQDRLHVSSRFEGTVYRIGSSGELETVATDLGVTCGLAFDSDGTLYAGDRSGTIFRVSASGDATAFATLPPSVAAFHLAFGPDGMLYVTAPTLSPYDSVYRIGRTGGVEVVSPCFGRPQGLAFDAQGMLYVVEALAGASGVYRVCEDGSVEHLLAAGGLVGLALDPAGGMVVASNDTAYRLDVRVRRP
jgi:sugar lactone lactonase YvrE